MCPTELIAFSDRHREFDAINAKVIGVSTDTEEVHLAWCRTPRKKGGLGKMQIPLVADPTHAISKSYGTLAEDLGIAYRGLYIINPEGVVVHYSLTDFPVGRSVDETLRLIQEYQASADCRASSHTRSQQPPPLATRSFAAPGDEPRGVLRLEPTGRLAARPCSSWQSTGRYALRTGSRATRR